MKRLMGLLMPAMITISVLVGCDGGGTSSPATSWTKTFGGPSDDRAYSVQQTTDGGYIVAGETSSFGAGFVDVYLIKTDANGNTLWTKTYGGPGDDYAGPVRQTSDGGYIVAGYTNYFGGNAYLIKTDADGNTLWMKTYGGPGDERAYSVQQTTDGGYIVAGETSSSAGFGDAYLIKTDADGNTLWTKTYGGAGNDYAYAVQQTTDNGYIVAGGYNFLYGAGDSDAYLIKTDADGNTLWTKTYGGTGNESAYSVQQTTDGGYIVAGGIAPTTGVNVTDMYLFKTDANGNTIWTKTYGGTGDDVAYAVRQTTDNGYIVVGDAISYGVGGDAYLIKTDANGNTLWTKTYGGTGDESGRYVQQTSDGGYIVAGYTRSFGAGGFDAYLIKTDAGGNVSGSSF